MSGERSLGCYPDQFKGGYLVTMGAAGGIAYLAVAETDWTAAAVEILDTAGRLASRPLLAHSS